ncbi:MAG TPA: methyltransferase domain-containing protein [Thermoanaerobaculia bacterium]
MTQATTPIRDIAEIRELIACPLCKSSLSWTAEAAECRLCGSRYERRDGVWDFMLHYPGFLHAVNHLWEHGQEEYEEWNEKLTDDYDREVASIDEVREIYTDEFSLSGRILDVGGHDGRLRHWLPADAQYIGIDPYPAVKGAQKRPNLLRAYPVLQQPVSFVRAAAEQIPFAAETFDYVHMRSVIDHFGDPLRALLEARRVLKPGGGLMIGIHVLGHQSTIPEGSAASVAIARFRKKVRDEGLVTASKIAVGRIIGSHKDEHIWHPTHDTLVQLVEMSRFRIEKSHWQKPPNDHVIYLMARKA